jgi:hypothetical protein
VARNIVLFGFLDDVAQGRVGQLRSSRRGDQRDECGGA